VWQTHACHFLLPSNGTTLGCECELDAIYCKSLSTEAMSWFLIGHPTIQVCHQWQSIILMLLDSINRWNILYCLFLVIDGKSGRFFYLLRVDKSIWTRRLTPLLTIFQLYRGCQFHWWRKPEDQEKTTELSQVTDDSNK
jgi:hypothetical protein